VKLLNEQRMNVVRDATKVLTGEVGGRKFIAFLTYAITPANTSKAVDNAIRLRLFICQFRCR